MKTSLFLVSAACAISTAWAQTPPTPPVVGTVQAANGLVTVSQNGSLGNAAAGTPLTNGARVVSTSNGSAIVRLNNGCSVSLAPNRSVIINPALACDVLAASVVSVGVPIASASAGGVAAGSAGAGALLFAVPVLAFVADRNSETVQSLSGR